MGIHLYVFSYLFIFIADNKELHGLASTVHHLIEYKTTYIKSNLSHFNFYVIQKYQLILKREKWATSRKQLIKYKKKTYSLLGEISVPRLGIHIRNLGIGIPNLGTSVRKL